MASKLLVAILGISLPMVLARAFLPEDYGTFKQAWLLSTTLYLVLPFGLTPSLLFFVPRDRANARAYVSHVMVVMWSVGLLSAVVLFAFGGWIAELFHNPELAAVMPMVAAITALRLGGQCWDVTYLSEGKVGVAAWIRALYEAFYTGCVVVAALFTHSAAGALAAITFAFALRAGVCTIQLLRRYGFVLDRALLVRQIRYAVPFGVAFALLIPQQQFHFYAVSAAVPAAAFAVYTVGCLQLPVVDMLYTPMSDVMQLAIAEEDGRGNHEAAVALFRETVSRLSFVFIPLLVLALVVAPELIRFFFTERYAEAVPLFRITLLSIPLAALPLEGLMRARAQHRFMLVVSISKLASTIVLVLLGLRWFGLVGAIVGFMLSEEVGRGLMLWRTIRILGTSLAGVLPLRDLAVRAMVACVAGAAAYGAVRVQGSRLLQLAVAGVVFAAVYLGILGSVGGLGAVADFIPMRKRAPPEELGPRAAA